MKKFYEMFIQTTPAVFLRKETTVFGKTGYPDQVKYYIRLREGEVFTTVVDNRKIHIVGHGMDQDVSVVAEHHSRKDLLIAVLNKDAGGFLLQNSVVVKTEQQLEEILNFRWKDITDKDLCKKKLAEMMAETYPSPDPTIKHWCARFLPECYDRFEADWIELANRQLV